MYNSIYCRQCKAEIDPSHEFCPKCGASQKPGTGQLPPQVVIMQPERSSIHVIVTLIGVVIIAICGTAGYIYVRDSDARNVDNAHTAATKTAASRPQSVVPNANAPTTNPPPYQSQQYQQQAAQNTYRQPQSNGATDNGTQQSGPAAASQELAALDKLVGDYNSYLRRMDDSAIKQDGYFQASLHGATADDITSNGNKMDHEFTEFIAAAGSALQSYSQIVASPLYAQNYRETTMLSSSAQTRFEARGAVSVSRAASLRYIEKR